MVVKEEKKENNERKLGDLAEEEFFKMMKQHSKVNVVECDGIAVSSTTESLIEVEKAVNRLLDKHKNFLLMRKEMKAKMGYTG